MSEADALLGEVELPTKLNTAYKLDECVEF